MNSNETDLLDLLNINIISCTSDKILNTSYLLINSFLNNKNLKLTCNDFTSLTKTIGFIYTKNFNLDIFSLLINKLPLNNNIINPKEYIYNNYFKHLIIKKNYL